MRQWKFGWMAACLWACTCGHNLHAQAVARIQVTATSMPAIGGGQRLANMDAIVVGRVIGMEPMDVTSAPVPGMANVTYRIAVVQISDRLHGVKDVGMVRVGFLLGNPNAGFGNGGGIQVLPAAGPVQMRAIRYPAVQLQVGQDGLFLLAKHPRENFYLIPTYQHFVSSQNNTAFDSEVKNARQLGKVLGDVRAALKSEDRQERFLAAAVLISRYRNNPTGLATKQEPIDAEESKLILKSLAEGDWTPGRFSSSQPTPLEMFQQLGLTANDGFRPAPGNQQTMTQAMQKWLSDNGDKFVIKRLVADPSAKAESAAPVELQPARLRGGLRQAPGILPVPAPIAPVPAAPKGN